MSELSSTQGLTINRYDFNRGVTQDGPEATRVSIASGNVADFDLAIARGDYPSNLNPLQTVNSLKPYVAINAGFFDLFSAPYSWGPIIRDSKIEYFPLVNLGNGWEPYWRRVVGVTTHPVTTGGYGAVGSVTSQRVTLPTSGVNLDVVPAESAIVYDSRFTGATPKGSATLVIANDVVTDVFTSGASVEVPAHGYVIQAKGQYAVIARQFEIKPPAQVTIPDALTTGFMAQNSHVKIGALTLPIKFVNRADTTGISFFNSKWKTPTVAKSLTIVVTKGKVKAVYSPGRKVKTAIGTYVLQIAKPTKVQKKIRIGSKATLKLVIPDRTTGFDTNGTFASQDVALTLSAINKSVENVTAPVAFDSSWNKPTPLGAATLVVNSGFVTAVYPDGSPLIPAADELVIQVPPTDAPAVRSLWPTQSVTVDKGVDKRFVRTIQGGSLKMNGKLISGGVTIPITAMNFHSIAAESATAFDHNWLGTEPNHQTAQGDATVVVRNGKVVYVNPTGKPYVMTDANDIVIQTRGSISSQVSSIHVGDDADVQLTYTTRNHEDLKFINAVYRGVTNLENGKNVATCSSSTDGVRPRTAIGWNDTGKFWLMTTSPQEDTDTGKGGYRTGGSTVHQLGDWLKQLGATEAVSFDGGGSTVMIRNTVNGARRVDMASPDMNNNPWIRDVPIMLMLVDYVAPN